MTEPITEPIHLISDFWAVPMNCSADMPEGTWKYFCHTKEITREQACEIIEIRQVDYMRSDVQVTLYKNYQDEFKSYTDPMNSLISLLRSKGCDTSKNWVILIKK